MSSKNTIFLSNKHNVHIFEDGDSPRENDKGEWIGDDIFIYIERNYIVQKREEKGRLLISVLPSEGLKDLSLVESDIIYREDKENELFVLLIKAGSETVKALKSIKYDNQRTKRTNQDGQKRIRH